LIPADADNKATTGRVNDNVAEANVLVEAMFKTTNEDNWRTISA
jgi:hypothetical protein